MLSFDASQSLWGGGSSASFKSAWAFDLGPVGFGYDVRASTGTVEASLKGIFSVGYAPSLAAPGMLPLSMGFIGTPQGGSLKSDLGASVDVWAKVLLEVPIIEEGYSLKVDQAFTPVLGAQVQGKDSVALAGTGIDIGIASVGANFNIDQTDRLTVFSLDGVLDYGLRGSGVTRSLPFSIGSAGGADLSVALNQGGDWDFQVRDLSLSNSFSASFGASLSVYERHVDGIDWCKAWIFWYPCGFSYDTNEVTLASLNLYHAPAFALDFDEIASAQRFSVAVVPEPGSVALLALGLAVLGAMQRRRRHHELMAGAARA